MKKNTSCKFTDESSVTFQSSVSGRGEFGLRISMPYITFTMSIKGNHHLLYITTYLIMGITSITFPLGKNWGCTWLFLFILLQTHKEGVTANGSGYPSLSLRLSIIQTSLRGCLEKKIDSRYQPTICQLSYLLYCKFIMYSQI